MLDFIILLLSAMGMLNVFLYSPLSEKLKEKIVSLFAFFGKEKLGAYLIQCPTCSGFWVGVILLPIYYYGFIIFTLPFAISFCGYICSLFYFPEDEFD